MNGRLPRMFPFLDWWRLLRQGEVLRADLLAGITVALVLVPQSMAYAQLAGLPAYHGLYAAFLPPMVAALFGSSRQLSSGPVAVVSLMSAAALQPLATAGSDAFLAYAVVLALISGVFQLLLGFLRLGLLVDLLSNPVVVGFTNAGALIIASSQLDKLFGVQVEAGVRHHQTVSKVLSAALHHTHWWTLAMGLGAMLLMLGLRRWRPAWPGVLIAVLVTTTLSWLGDFPAHGGRVVGEIPVGLPAIAVPKLDWAVVSQLLTNGLVIALVGFVEAIAIARAVAAHTRQRLDTNQELIGQGLANLAAAFSGGYAVSGSFSRSALNIHAGARTGFASVVAGTAVALTLLFLTPLLYYLPNATLGAVIIMAVLHLVRIRPIVHAWQVRRLDAMVAVLTFLLTLYTAPHLEWGVLTGVVLSVLLFVIHGMRPRIVELARHHDGTLRDVALYPNPLSPVIAVIRFEGSLYFANAGYFETKLLELVASRPQLRYIVIDAEGINQMDSTGETVFHELAMQFRDNDIRIALAHTRHSLLDAMRRTGLIGEVIDEGLVHSRLSTVLDVVWERLGDGYDRERCPLRSHHRRRHG